MSNQKKSKVKETNHSNQQKGLNYLAVVDENKCSGKGECIKVCEVNAITEGPKRIPNICACIGYVSELDPGYAIIDAEKCTGCGDCVPVCPNSAIEMILAVST